MSAIVKACLTQALIKNSGIECHSVMGPTGMIIAVPPALKFSDTDLLDPIAWITPLLHEDIGKRVYPFFGFQAPINFLTNTPEADVTITLDDGTMTLVRLGFINRLYETTKGGLCYAQSLASLYNSGYYILEIDKQDQMLACVNEDGTYSGIPPNFMYAPTPTLADLRSTTYRNRFQVNFDPEIYFKKTAILKGARQFMPLMGLIDAKLKAITASSVTKLRFAVLTDCAETDMLALFPTQIPLLANFKVVQKDTQATITPTAAAIVNGVVELTGTFTTAKTYIVYGTGAKILKTSGVTGYEITKPVEILIP